MVGQEGPVTKVVTGQEGPVTKVVTSLPKLNVWQRIDIFAKDKERFSCASIHEFLSDEELTQPIKEDITKYIVEVLGYTKKPIRVNGKLIRGFIKEKDSSIEKFNQLRKEHNLSPEQIRLIVIEWFDNKTSPIQ